MGLNPFIIAIIVLVAVLALALLGYVFRALRNESSIARRKMTNDDKQLIQNDGYAAMGLDPNGIRIKAFMGGKRHRPKLRAASRRR
jgi:hypothetical protein